MPPSILKVPGQLHDLEPGIEPADLDQVVVGGVDRAVLAHDDFEVVAIGESGEDRPEPGRELVDIVLLVERRDGDRDESFLDHGTYLNTSCSRSSGRSGDMRWSGCDSIDPVAVMRLVIFGQ